MNSIAATIVAHALRRAPDFIVGGPADPYLLRWYITPWSGLYRDIPNDQKTLWQKFVSRLPAIYVHEFRRSDEDRALHDHPWINCSILVGGSYVEHTIGAGGINVRTQRAAGDVVWRLPSAAHRVEIAPGTVCRTLFLTGPRVREWGFHCTRGWVPWQRFVATNDRGAVGAGCGEDHG
ncbi:hypothetical protein [Rhodanobacter sp. BL-MT-08]